jgi:Ca2+/Na+ antiporter
MIEVYFWTLSIVWCLKTKYIYIRTKNPKKTKIQTTEQQTSTNTHTQNKKPEYTKGNKTTHDISETGSVSILTWGRKQSHLCILVLCFVCVCLFVGVCFWSFLGFLVLCLYFFFFFFVLRHQTMDKVQKYTSINVNTPSSETYRSDQMYVVSHHQNVRQNHSLLIANKSFENVAKFMYLGTRVTDQNCSNEEIKSRLILGNACYHSVQNLLSFRLLSKNLKLKVYKIPFILYGY